MPLGTFIDSFEENQTQLAFAANARAGRLIAPINGPAGFIDLIDASTY